MATRSKLVMLRATLMTPLKTDLLADTIAAPVGSVEDAVNAMTMLAPNSAGIATARTVGVDAEGIEPASFGRTLAPVSAANRTTVLPRIEGEGARVRLVAELKTRYEPVRMLGAGGMGEVVLVHDQDIARKVAVKRLLPEASDPVLLARFVDEIRTVGRLEHPNIVPIHDVGVDDQGRYFFVMKYVEGETLETVIEKLAAGDPEYHKVYAFERRVEIFTDVLNALSYAHENGVVHRDIKPANVMVGRYGEVMLMDWGIAKPIAASRDLAKGTDGTLGEAGKHGRMFMTHVGALVGTPAYMSPEQARGEVDKLDARSDIYSACAMFFELITLRHYLGDQTTMEDLLASILTKELTKKELHKLHPAQNAHPVELVYIAKGGLEKDPANRYSSASEPILLLQDALSGKIHMQCSATMTKRFLREAARAVDKNPNLVFAGLIGAFVAVLFSVIEIVRLAVT